MTNQGDVTLEVSGGIAHLTLNRPDDANGINLSLARALLDATNAIADDRTARVVLLRGAGRRFCGGGDIKSFAEHSDLPAYLSEMLGILHQAVRNLTEADAPVVTAVQGSAAGAGLGLVGASDIVLAGESAKFVMAYTGIGLTPDGSSSWFLPRLIGLRRSVELALTNRVLSAMEAVQVGLITKVVPDYELDAAAEEIAVSLANGPTDALAATKRLFNASLTATLESQLEREATTISAASGSPEAQEGIAAFLDKRPPEFPHN